tara:strand:+ start:343 stop:1011 length:669 start_codon:yes stop_codon:yes gene_type:complete
MSQVTLSTQTLNVLKNYSTINSSIVFRKGNVIRTISNAENILAKYTSEESFPTDFAIYDLGQFLSGLSLFDNPQLDFASGDFVTIRSGGRSAKYYFSDPEITLKSAPEKNVKFPGGDISFDISSEELFALQKASSVYDLPDLTFDTTKGSIKLILRDKENDTSNTFEQDATGDYEGEFSLDVKIENIRLVPGNYSVKVSSQLISEWTNRDTDLTYYIALEPA